MRAALVRLLRSLLRRGKLLLKSSQLGKNLLSDINNSEEFTSLLSHERMLADQVRVETYHKAISHHVKPGSIVIDLGTGTGILALFAAQQRPRKVYALDHSDFIDVARKIAAHNNAEDIIEFIPTNSREFTPEEKADLLLHEQIGDELFTENMLENLLDLKRRALKPDGRIMPGHFQLFVEPAQFKHGRNVPFIWEQKIHGIDFSLLKDDVDTARYKPDDYGCCFIEATAVDHWLGDPEPAISVDLNQISNPSEMRTSVRIEREVIHAGYMDGLVIYFRVIFDDTLSFDTSPMSVQTHWRCRLFRLPRRYYEAGDVIVYQFSMIDPADSGTWSIQTLNQSGILNPADARPANAPESGSEILN